MEIRERESLRVHLLGTCRLFVNGEVVSLEMWKSKKALLLFAYFLTLRGKKIRRDVLLDLLWPEDDAETASNRLHTAIHTLRRTIQPDLKAFQDSAYIRYSSGLYWFDATDSCWIDVDRFELLVREGDELVQKDPCAALDQYKQALALYQGDFMQELAYEDWAIAERDRLRESFIALSLRTSRILMDLRADVSEVVRVLRQALSVDPYREEIHQNLMSYLIAAGHHAEAAIQYQRLIKMLDEQFGLPPSPDTQALFGTMKHEKSPAHSDLLPAMDEGYAVGPFVCNRQVFWAIHMLSLRRQPRYAAPTSILSITAHSGKPTSEQVMQVFLCLQKMLRRGDVLCHDTDRILVQLPHTGRIPCDIVKRRIERGLLECNLSLVVTARVFDDPNVIAAMSPQTEPERDPALTDAGYH